MNPKDIICPNHVNSLCATYNNAMQSAPRLLAMHYDATQHSRINRSQLSLDSVLSWLQPATVAQSQSARSRFFTPSRGCHLRCILPGPHHMVGRDAALMSTVATMAASANVAVAKAKGQQLPSRGHQWHPGIPRGVGTVRTERPWTSTARRRRAGRLASGNHGSLRQGRLGMAGEEEDGVVGVNIRNTRRSCDPKP